MHVFLNGRIVPKEEAVVSVFDRSFQLGDGLFETIRVSNGRPFRWNQHMDRLESGAVFLGIDRPFDREELREQLRQLVAINELPQAILRLHLSRGVGRRGYSPAGAKQPTCVMSLHPTPAVSSHDPQQWKVVTSTFQLQASSPLNRFKTSSKLVQIMARAEADAARADEAILLNSDGIVLEGTAANLLWVKGTKVSCVPSDRGALPGVTQAVIREICRQQEIPVIEDLASVDRIRGSDGCFLALTSLGIVEIVEWDQQKTNRSPMTHRLLECYRQLVDRECAED